jgi:hypothetical protein
MGAVIFAPPCVLSRPALLADLARTPARDPMHRARQHGIIIPVSAAVWEVSCSLAAR